MNDRLERVLLQTLDESAVVRGVENGIAGIARVVDQSVFVGLCKTIASQARRNLHVVIMTAVASHLFLTIVVGRPQHWYWVILPASFAGLAVLIARRHGVSAHE